MVRAKPRLRCGERRTCSSKVGACNGATIWAHRKILTGEAFFTTVPCACMHAQVAPPPEGLAHTYVCMRHEPTRHNVTSQLSPRMTAPPTPFLREGLPPREREAHPPIHLPLNFVVGGEPFHSGLRRFRTRYFRSVWRDHRFLTMSINGQREKSTATPL